MNSETAHESTGGKPQIHSGSTIPQHACAACHQVFPETMAVRVGQRWLCMLCKERALEDEKNPRREYSMRTWAPDVEKWHIVLAVIAVLGFILRLYLVGRMDGTLSDEDKPEPWVTKASEDWPQLVAGASADFRDNEDKALVAGGNVFFVQKSDAEIVSVTVAANAQSDGDDASARDAGASKFASRVSQWTALGAKGAAFPLGKILPTTNKAFLQGVVIAGVSNGGQAPSRPLHLRSAPYASGMKLYVVTVRKGGGQSVHRGTVMSAASSDGLEIVTTYRSRYSQREFSRGDGSATILKMEAPVPATDLAGALVMDMRGYAAGVVTAAEPATEKGDTITEVEIFGGDAFRDALNPNNARRAESKALEKPRKEPLKEA